MWIIFAGSINVSRAAYQGLAPVHPFDLASAKISTTHEQITHLDKLVDLSPGTFAQYQKLKTNKWLSETFPKKKEKESHCADDYFDTYEEFPVKTGQCFFDAKEEIDLDPSTNLCDVMYLDSIYQGRLIIDCTGKTYACEATEEYPVEANLAPSECAMCLLLDDAVFTPVALSTTDIFAQLIFDTGASLVLSPFRSDFVADPTPLARPRQLGGMGKGLQIEGVGTVAWTFTAKDKS
jgi:hypothetical protein